MTFVNSVHVTLWFHHFRSHNTGQYILMLMLVAGLGILLEVSGIRSRGACRSVGLDPCPHFTGPVACPGPHDRGVSREGGGNAAAAWAKSGF